MVKDYDDITDLIKKTKQRIRSRYGDLSKVEQDELIKFDSTLNGGGARTQGLVQIKRRVERTIEKELVFWPLWTEWMQNIPGIGATIAGKLILLYYYKFVPVCKDCGAGLEKQEGTFWCETCQKSVRGEGLSKYELRYKDFPNISAWRKYAGYHIVDGKMPKREKGKQSNWNSKGRKIGFLIGDQFNRQSESNPYTAFMLKRKARYQNDPAYADYSKGHIHNMARHQAVKLFFSHLWDVSKRLEGQKEPAKPWIIQFGGHTKYIAPYYFNEEAVDQAA